MRDQSLRGGGRLLESTGPEIRSVDDLLKAAKVDMTKFAVERFVVNKHDLGVAQKSARFTRRKERGKFVGVDKQEISQIKTKPMFQVKIWLKPIGHITGIVEKMLETAFARVEPPKITRVPAKRDGVWQVIPIADPHFGKMSWRKETGSDYDLKIADVAVRGAGTDLILRGEAANPSIRTLALLGDIFHYDTPQGTTTKGTLLDRDGRMQRMIEIGTDAIISLIEVSADSCATEVVVVPGNHDEASTWWLQRILQERFKNDKRVKIDGGYTNRKYARVGQTLLGFNHGEKVKKARLPGLMAHEASEHWGQSRYREIHTGHFHGQSAEWSRPIESIDGVVTRIAPAICPADGWHAENGFSMNPRAMESFLYHDKGGLLGTLVSSPDHIK